MFNSDVCCGKCFRIRAEGVLYFRTILFFYVNDDSSCCNFVSWQLCLFCHEKMQQIMFVSAHAVVCKRREIDWFDHVWNTRFKKSWIPRLSGRWSKRNRMVLTPLPPFGWAKFKRERRLVIGIGSKENWTLPIVPLEERVHKISTKKACGKRAQNSYNFRNLNGRSRLSRWLLNSQRKQRLLWLLQFRLKIRCPT